MFVVVMIMLVLMLVVMVVPQQQHACTIYDQAQESHHQGIIELDIYRIDKAVPHP